jgi:hypothetical protein
MNHLEETIGDLAKSMSDLAHRAVAEYAPIVDFIVREESQDTRDIEHTLDGAGFLLRPGGTAPLQETLPPLLLHRSCCHRGVCPILPRDVGF